MTNSPTRLWLAREQEVHGPYDPAQLIEMDAQGELLPDDHFRREDEDEWMDYQAWRDSLRKRSVIKPSQRVLSHTERVTIDQKRRNGEMKNSIRSHPSIGRVRHIGYLPDGQETAEQRLARMVATVNDHRRAEGHNHPLHFAEDHLIADAMVWLDYYYAGWDQRPLESQGSALRPGGLEKWLIPALGRVHPDLVKLSHQSDFETSDRWKFPA